MLPDACALAGNVVCDDCWVYQENNVNGNIRFQCDYLCGLQHVLQDIERNNNNNNNVKQSHYRPGQALRVPGG